MSRLTDLLHTVKQLDAELGADLEREVLPLQERLPFGLNFEKHQPEAVELPGVAIRAGSKVRMLPARGEMAAVDRRLWIVREVQRAADRSRKAHLYLARNPDEVRTDVPVEDLVLVAEFRDPIFPGLRPTGSVRAGGDRPFHSVINGENFHVLEALTFTHRERVDVIFIDPPYNTGARDWKYNNDYVEGDDLYRHSKWLAFMERRLKVAKQLLNPARSVLIVSIDEKEYLRLGLLLEQTFTDARIQMVSSVINPKGSSRRQDFARSDEYLFFVMIGDAAVIPTGSDMTYRDTDNSSKPVRWAGLKRQGANGRRVARPNLFYPIFVSNEERRIHSVGDSLPITADRATVSVPTGTTAIWPMSNNGSESTWGRDPDSLRAAIKLGYVKMGRFQPGNATCAFQHLQSGQIAALQSGELVITGHDADGSLQVAYPEGGGRKTMPTTAWHRPSHSASEYGSSLLAKMLPGRTFPFPKSLYAVEDALRFFVADKPDAVIVDFFAGSGTTAHAVMRLNHQDGGKRQAILITNNEVGADEQRDLREQGLRPGDPAWEEHGICEYITKPRIEAAITGQTPEGEPISGEYKFVDEFEIAEGFEENAQFFTLTYESVWRVSQNRAFAEIAPLLWLRAGAQGRCITVLTSGWDVADSYGVLDDLDKSADFIDAVRRTDAVRVAYVITDDDRRYQMVADSLGEIEMVRLYSSYLQDFKINNGIAS